MKKSFFVIFALNVVNLVNANSYINQYWCNTYDDCLNVTNSKYCHHNKCVECIGDINCISNSNCGSMCEYNKCITYFHLNCTVNIVHKHCLSSQQRCVECLNNADCPYTKPYCRNEYGGIRDYKCVECKYDNECRHNKNCNSICGYGKCIDNPDGVLDCFTHHPKNKDKCDKFLMRCIECNTDTDCVNAERHCFNGMCHECYSNKHCKSNHLCVFNDTRMYCINRSNSTIYMYNIFVVLLLFTVILF